MSQIVISSKNQKITLDKAPFKTTIVPELLTVTLKFNFPSYLNGSVCLSIDGNIKQPLSKNITCSFNMTTNKWQKTEL